MSVLRVWLACLLGVAIVAGLGIVVVPGARADNPPVWNLTVSARCGDGAACGGFTTLAGYCTFVGETAGVKASCQSLLTGDIGVATESIQGTSWDMEISPFMTPNTGVADFFITDGTITYTGPTILGFIAAGGPQAFGCSTTGATVTCSIPALEPSGIYSPDTLDPVILGHYASNVCWGTGLTDPSCSFNQQLTLVS